MKPDDLKHLLGGYATGTLTPEEQKALFDAALYDQSLFDALAGEQALKEAFDDPAVRRELIADLAPPVGLRDRLAAWLRPAIPIGAAGALAAATIAVVFFVRGSGPKPVEVAQVQPPQQITATAPAPLVTEPAKTPETKREAPLPRERVDQGRARVVPPPPAYEAAPAVAPPLEERKAESSPAVAPPPPPPSAAPAGQPQPSFRSSIVTSEAQSVPRPSQAARELFYAPPLPPFPAGNAAVAPAPGGVVGGVIGGAPSAVQMSAPRAKRSERAVLDSAAPVSAVAAPTLGLRYSAQKTGDLTSLVVEANSDSVVYLFRRTAAQDWAPVTSGGLSLKARTPATTPGFAAEGVQPSALLVLSRRPLPQLAQTGAALALAIDAIRAESNAARLVKQESGASTFVVLPQPRGSEAIVVPVSLP